jgi:hypothetical protein
LAGSKKIQDTNKLRPDPAQAPVSRAELELLIRKVAELASKDPAKAATILTEWVRKTPLTDKNRKAG